MTMSLADFSKRLTSSGLMSADEVRTFVEGLPADARPVDGAQLAKVLLRERRLTRFQAEQVYAGKGSTLTFGNYVILDKLGQGGMGMVLKAEHQRMKRVVALKVLSPDAVKTPDAVRRFEREVQAAAKLEHPNIVTAYDADRANNTTFLVMQFVDGDDLSAIVKKTGRLPVDRAVDCVMQAARGLEFAHQRGVIHRDIKPANLLLGKDGVVKILDMGLARIDDPMGSSHEASLTGTGTVMGTIDYMSPEQALDTKTANAQSDIYSLGCTLFYLVTGTAPYPADTVMKRLLAHRDAPIPPLDGAPYAVELIFRRMVAKNPVDRYTTMTEVVSDLQRCLTAPPASPIPMASSTLDSNLTDFLAKLSQADEATTSAAIGGPVVETRHTRLPQNSKNSTADAATTQWNVGVSDRNPNVIMSSSANSDLPRWMSSMTTRTKLIVLSVAGVLAAVALLLLLNSSQTPAPVLANKSHAEESSDFKSSSEGRSTADNGAAVEHFALKFDGQSFVEIPSLQWDGKEPVTLEFVVSVDDAAAALAGTSVCASWISRDSTEELVAYRYNNLWACDMRLSTSRWISSVGSIRPNERLMLTCIWDGKQTLVLDNGNRGNTHSHGADPILGKPGFTIGGSDGYSSQLFQGSIEQIRISRGVRTPLTAVPAGRLAKEKSTIALYHFAEGRGNRLVDTSGNNHHGNIVGAKWVKVVPRHNALEFDGFVKVEVPSLRIQRGGPLTLEAYFTPTVDRITKINQLLGFQFNSLFISPETQNWQLVWQHGDQLAISSQADPFVKGRRVHVAGVIKDGESRLYVDGKLSASSPVKFDSEFAQQELSGLHIGTGFEGQIDTVRISTAARYQSDFVPADSFQPDQATVALYHFSEGNGNELRDSSGNQNHGRITGAKWVHADVGPVTNDPDRRAAMYVLSVGGTVQINDIPQNYININELPKSRFRLTSIILHDCKQVSAAGLAACRGCQHLTQFQLSISAAVGNAGMEPFRQCKKLKVLALSGTSVTDAGLAYFDGCPDLITLSLHERLVTDIGLTNFKDCLKLESLDLAHLRMTAQGIGSFQDCRNIQSLSLSNTPLGDDAFAEWKSFPKLRSLSFTNEGIITNAGLASLSSLQNLTFLNVHATQVDDAGVESLKKLIRLTRLRLNGTQLTPAGIAELSKALPNCKIESDVAPMNEMVVP